ncbi:hypothetical protein AGABI1DRAFT_108866 [Agaricus bisporus var. burnettii JB137-S8]|uniref:Uncharacterized protein n=1 Tax=Agaricus bisporus var. burnettii (strain JB137-S8 / ATCC MYA-4627 / FGSC 10392) TaxID=597362 RepID=K5X0B9_AGABU|nr:uncharacterized protein AGABI1DRAFT_108866 [Agaricus bisporus var. burnettii JB137-S8]EKM76322.1 hypothetical protein AGABI1DRAFT_108866 [Agaricus bisporus var. burnettii JB137-S8]
MSDAIYHDANLGRHNRLAEVERPPFPTLLDRNAGRRRVAWVQKLYDSYERAGEFIHSAKCGIAVCFEASKTALYNAASASYGPLQKPSEDCSMEGHCSSPTLSWLIDNERNNRLTLQNLRSSELRVPHLILWFGLWFGYYQNSYSSRRCLIHPSSDSQIYNKWGSAGICAHVHFKIWEAAKWQMTLSDIDG